MKTSILRFPGSNCDQDCLYVLGQLLGCEARYIWHADTDLQDPDLVIIPGGFSYGDYLRAGAIAKVSPIMQSVKQFAEKGGYVLGICNGFQILLENHMLPGAMQRNQHLEFICKDVYLRLLSTTSTFTSHLESGRVLQIPIAHAEGNYFIDDDGLKRLFDQNQVVFQYCDVKGEISPEVNPNGSVGNIAGITNEKGNVLGMMPHPERASEALLGSEDGKLFLKGIVEFLSQ